MLYTAPTRNDGNQMPLTVGVLRELFRNLAAWRATFEAEGIDTLTSPEGDIFCLWDIEYLYSQIYRLSPRQREAIQLCLVDNVKEVDAARLMGVSETNPVAMYATLGLKKLLDLIDKGELSRYRPENAA
jgi:hypothetical protein